MAITWVSSDNADSTVQFGLSKTKLTNSVQSDSHVSIRIASCTFCESGIWSNNSDIYLRWVARMGPRRSIKLIETFHYVLLSRWWHSSRYVLSESASNWWLTFAAIGWSQVYSFSTYSDNFADYAQLPQTFLMIGDMGADPQAPNTIKILEQYGNLSFEQTHLG